MASNAESNSELVAMTSLFNIEGELISVQKHKSGLINTTFLSSYKSLDKVYHYIHQRINNQVFKDVEGLMRNIDLVTKHLKSKKSNTDKIVELVNARNGKNYAVDEKQSYWRTYKFIEGTKSVDVCENLIQAEEAAGILGRFQSHLLDFDPAKLIETIPQFLSSPKRYRDFVDSLNRDSHDRRKSAEPEIHFVTIRESFFSIIEDEIKKGSVPTRITHSDTKLNNVLFDQRTNLAVSLVDLDTCMPGYSLYDYGDLVRNTAILAAEDEQDFSKVTVNLEYFQAITKGYLKFAAKFLNAKEISLMHLAPRLLALTLGVRFLTDYLSGDSYFRTERSMHNLERARTQFKIVERMESMEDALREIVRASKQQ